MPIERLIPETAHNLSWPVLSTSRGHPNDYLSVWVQV